MYCCIVLTSICVYIVKNEYLDCAYTREVNEREKTTFKIVLEL
jgi:hypothetical protein